MNNKGFVLIELLVVTVFIMTIFIFIYNNSIPMISIYEQRSHYNDIDTLYYANLISNSMVKPNYNEFSYDAFYNYLKDISDCNIYPNNSHNNMSKSYCVNLKKMMNIKDDDYILLITDNLSQFKTKLVEGTLDSFFNRGFFRGIKDFLNYIPIVQTQAKGYDHAFLVISRTVENDTYAADGSKNEVIKKYAIVEVAR